MKKKTIITALASLLFIGTFFLTWVDYKVQKDLTGLAFLSHYRYLVIGFLVLSVLLALLGEYAVISGLFVLLFLAELFYGSHLETRFLAGGFYASLAMTAVMGFLFIIIKDNAKRNIIRKLRKKDMSGELKSEEDEIEL